MVKKQRLFDDVVADRDGEWSQICSQCASSIHLPKSGSVGGVCICGVAGCNNEADYYVDFPSESAT